MGILALLGMAQLAVLARYIEPNAFGLAAVAGMVIAVGRIFADAGLGEVLIQRKHLSAPQFSALYWTNISTGLTGALVITLAARPVADMLGEPLLEHIIPVAALTLLVAPMSSLHQAMARKEMQFGALSIAEVAAAGVGFLVAVISAAVFAQGVWAIIFGGLAQSVTVTAIFLLRGNAAGLRPSLNVDWHSLPGMLKFGLYRVGTGVLNLVRMRADQAIIAATLGTQALGFYVVAVQIMEVPLKRIPATINRVMLPAFSLIQDDPQRLTRGFLRVVVVVSSVVGPVVFGIAAIADDGIRLYLGEGWEATAGVLQLIPLYVVLRSAAGAAGTVVVARGKADWAFVWSLMTLPVVLVAVWLSSLAGHLTVVAATLSGLQVVLFWAHWRFILRRVMDLPLGLYVRAAVTPVLIALAMAIVVIGSLAGMEALSPLQRVTAGIGIGLVVYAAGTLVFNRPLAAIVRERLFCVRQPSRPQQPCKPI